MISQMVRWEKLCGFSTLSFSSFLRNDELGDYSLGVLTPVLNTREQNRVLIELTPVLPRLITTLSSDAFSSFATNNKSMTARGKFDQQYADIMRNHPFGVAVYRPLSQIIFKVGACGYFDDFGSWQPIVDLERPNQLLEKKLTPPEKLEKAPLDDGIEWGPKVSSKTTAKKIGLSGGV